MTNNRMEKNTTVAKILMILSSLSIALTSSKTQNHPIFQRNRLYTFALPSPDSIPMSSVSPPNSFNQNRVLSSYVPHPSPAVSDTSFNGINSFQKLIIPIPLSHLANSLKKPDLQTHMLPTNAPPITHHPVTYNIAHEKPLHIAHPTIQVPKFFSNNPPKYIQLLQFPKVIRPFQPLKPTQEVHHMGVTEASIQLSHHPREPVFADYIYSIVNKDDNNNKLVHSVTYNKKLDLVDELHASGSTNINKLASNNIINSVQQFHHGSGSRKDLYLTTNTLKHNKAYSTSIKNPVLSSDPKKSNDVNLSKEMDEAVNKGSMPAVQLNGNAEIDLSELLDTFSISKLTSTAKEEELTKNTTAKLIIDQRPKQNDLNVTENNTTTSNISSDTKNITAAKQTDKSTAGSQEAIKETTQVPTRIAEKVGLTRTAAKPFANIADQLKLRSYLFRNPSFNLLEKYSTKIQPEKTFSTTMLVPSDLEGQPSTTEEYSTPLQSETILTTTQLVSGYLEDQAPTTTSMPPSFPIILIFLNHTSSTRTEKQSTPKPKVSIPTPTNKDQQEEEMLTEKEEEETLTEKEEGETLTEKDKFSPALGSTIEKELASIPYTPTRVKSVLKRLEETTIAPVNSTSKVVVEPISTELTDVSADNSSNITNNTATKMESEVSLFNITKQIPEVTTLKLDLNETTTISSTFGTTPLPTQPQISADVNKNGSNITQPTPRRIMKKRIRVVLKRRTNDPTRQILSRRIYLKVQKE